MHHIQVNSLAPGKCGCIVNFQTHIKKYHEHFLWECPQVNVTRPHWWLVNIGSGNGLVLSGTKPLLGPMCAHVLWWHMASLGHKDLTWHGWGSKWTCHPGGYYRDCCIGNLPFCQVTAMHSTCVQSLWMSSGHLTEMIGYQDSSPITGCQATCPIQFSQTSLWLLMILQAFSLGILVCSTHRPQSKHS